jgi:hypothetical protein
MLGGQNGQDTLITPILQQNLPVGTSEAFGVTNSVL